MKDLNQLEGDALALLSQYADEKTVVSFSGGKDSLVVLDLASRVGIKRGVFCDTTIEFDETIKYVDYVADFLGVQIEIVRAPVDFFSLLDRITVPSRRQRWCCEVFKFGPLARWALDNGVETYVTGLRKEESTARLEYGLVDKNPLVPVRQLNPILNWQEADVWNYINTYNLPPNPLYQHFERIGCWCCPFKTDDEWSKLADMKPEKVQFLKKKLSEIADREGIKDPQRFTHANAWTYWIHSTRRVSIGIARICQGNSVSELIIDGKTEGQIKTIADILPVLTTDFRRISKNLRVSVPSNKEQKLRILVEKAINCVGCGACLSYCEKCALYIKDGHIAVDVDCCDRCGSCLNASAIKGSCIARHYSPRRNSLVVVRKA